MQNICAESFSYREVLRKLGYNSDSRSNMATLKKNISIWNIDTSHFDKSKAAREASKNVKREKYALDEILVVNSTITQKVLRGYVRRHKVIDYKCALCGCDGHWNNMTIALELDHINGNNTDNRITNLRYLCPNCHASTVTYRGRNKHLKHIS